MKTSSTTSLINRSICRKASGFTMVELVAVAVLIALFSSVAISFGRGTFKRLQVEKAAKEVYFAAKYARILAVEKQCDCKLVLNEIDHGIFLAMVNPEAEDGEMTPVSDQFSKPVKFDEGVKFEQITIATFSEASDDENVITFKPNGTADTAVIQIGDDKSKYTVYIMASTGKVKIQFGPAEEVPIDIIDLDEI
ncbi:MAG: hypothetical protein KAS23_04345 [Anaerohalosphaera sp.]|nr:hypothetical protein [Anaerohalosphaera sp.]